MSSPSSLRASSHRSRPCRPRRAAWGSRSSPGGRWRARLSILALAALGTTASGEEPLDLPTLPGYSRAATRDLNNRGAVVGVALDGELGAPRQAVLWQRRPWRATTVEPLPAPGAMESAEAVAISRSGIPVGFSFLGSGSFRALVWRKGPAGEWEAVDLEPPPGFTDAVATGVNARGAIVGWAANPREIVGGDVVQRAVRWERRRHRGYSVVVLDTPDGFQSRATAISERGDVVGTAFRTEVGDDGPFLRSDIVVWRRPFGRHGCDGRPPVILASLPGLPTNGDPAINPRGDVVARAEVRIGLVTTSRPVLWKRHPWDKRHRKKHASVYGSPVELPVPEGFTDASATDINAFGRVVGTAFVRQGAALLSSRAVVWSEARPGSWRVEELEATGRGLFLSAFRVNDRGWVTGNEFPPSAGGTGALLWRSPAKRGCSDDPRGRSGRRR